MDNATFLTEFTLAEWPFLRRFLMTKIGLIGILRLFHLLGCLFIGLSILLHPLLIVCDKLILLVLLFLLYLLYLLSGVVL